MRALELFSGTKSIGKSLQKLGCWEVVSLDFCDKFQPTICKNIMHWDYTCFPPGHFDFIWASPDCTEYSVAKTTGVRDLQKADDLVLKTLSILSYYRPLYYAIENPATGLLKTRGILDDWPWKDVTYCSYGTEYRKHTRIWTNLGNYWAPRPLCTRKCASCISNGGVHGASAQKGPSGGNDKTTDNFTRDQLYKIPEPLCDELAAAVTAGVRALRDF